MSTAGPHLCILSNGRMFPIIESFTASLSIGHMPRRGDKPESYPIVRLQRLNR